MVHYGGKAEAYEVPAETATALTAAAELQAQAAAAVDETVSEVTEAAADVKRAVTVDLPTLPAAAAAAVTGLAAGIDIKTADAAKLQAAGVEKVSSLYKLAATPQGRAELAKTTGLSADAILVMEKKLDLMRVKGVGPKYATLLVASGIDSVAELAGRNPANLLGTMTEVNAAQHIVDALPSEADVAGWVAQAKALPKVVVF
jgi:predicted flap endonuclease-1-like 5' DNA nuclease